MTKCKQTKIWPYVRPDSWWYHDASAAVDPERRIPRRRVDMRHLHSRRLRRIGWRHRVGAAAEGRRLYGGGTNWTTRVRNAYLLLRSSSKSSRVGVRCRGTDDNKLLLRNGSHCVRRAYEKHVDAGELGSIRTADIGRATEIIKYRDTGGRDDTNRVRCARCDTRAQSARNKTREKREWPRVGIALRESNGRRTQNLEPWVVGTGPELGSRKNARTQRVDERRGSGARNKLIQYGILTTAAAHRMVI